MKEQEANMNNKEFIEINKQGWNTLIKSGKKFSNTILPEYGPFLKRNEDKINLLDNIKGANVLDLGCGEGESLEYLYNKGAAEIWGLDISEEQINNAKKRFPNFINNFVVGAMEDTSILPVNYFDYVVSIFSIGYTSDIGKTFKNVSNYLKDDGYFVVSWTHPLYYTLDINKQDEVIINNSYFSEDSEIITKGPDKINLAQKNLMISTMINEARKAGLYLEALLEEETVLKDDVNGYKSTFWRKEKTVNCPSTIIYKFIKKEK